MTGHGASGGRPAALTQADWLFDLDDTLYGVASGINDHVRARGDAYLARLLNLPDDLAEAERERRIGQAMAGHISTLDAVRALDGSDGTADRFYDYRYEAMSYDALAADAALAGALAGLSGRRIVFTNARADHAAEVLKRLAISHAFEAVYDIYDGGLVHKPDGRAYGAIVARFGLDPAQTVMVEDRADNLQPAKALGMTTVWIAHGRPLPGWAAAHVDHVVDGDLATWLSGPGG
ncbi:MAG: HAD-IA family hydrolase [Alphaproteobacteria bacterium]